MSTTTSKVLVIACAVNGLSTLARNISLQCMHHPAEKNGLCGEGLEDEYSRCAGKLLSLPKIANFFLTPAHPPWGMQVLQDSPRDSVDWVILNHHRTDLAPFATR